jgi:hypothetical protein
MRSAGAVANVPSAVPLTTIAGVQVPLTVSAQVERVTLGVRLLLAAGAATCTRDFEGTNVTPNNSVGIRELVNEVELSNLSV